MPRATRNHGLLFTRLTQRERSDREHDSSPTKQKTGCGLQRRKAVMPYEFERPCAPSSSMFARRRYETAFSEKNLKGFYPVEVRSRWRTKGVVYFFDHRTE